MKKELRVFIVILLVLCGSNSLFAQPFSPLSYDVTMNGELLKSAWAGGLNSPQFNEVDLNNDKVTDLMVFDRTGNRLLTFLNNNQQNTDTWVWDQGYASKFPEITNWVALKDYNGDQIADIFAYSDVPGIDGIQVYQGYFENDSLNFERVNFPEFFNVLYFTIPGGSSVPLRVTKIDYPAFQDMDCDGDLDVLTFNLGGGQIELFQNMSVENGYGLDSLIFRLSDFCWGGIYESGFTKEIDLAADAGDCAREFTDNPIQIRHAGSTILAYDRDNDGDQDLILGDLSFDNLNLLTNGGDCANPWISAQDIDFPSNDVTVDLPSFPAAFLIDANNDGIKDIVASPNFTRGVENYEVSWLYENRSTGNEPDYQLVNRRFLGEEMLDFGEQSHPAIFDVDQDGLHDLVVGNGGFFRNFDEVDASLFYLKNIGTANEPAFELVDANFLNLSDFNPDASNFTPTFGDLDNDGDLDLLVGEDGGGLYFAENIAAPGESSRFANWIYPYANISVGLSSAPQIVDINNDGLNDLVIGEQNGNINYFQNIGTAGNPQFNMDQNELPNNPFLGQVDARIPGFVFGSSQPFFFEENGELKMLLGTENGKIESYRNILGKEQSTFELESEFVGAIQEGFKSSLAMADLDQDQLLEIIVGNERGGLAIYQTAFKSDVTTSIDNPTLQEPSFSLYPNPASNKVWIDIKNTSPADWTVTIFDLNGRLLRIDQNISVRHKINTSDLNPGIYLLRLNDHQLSWTTKLIIE